MRLSQFKILSILLLLLVGGCREQRPEAPATGAYGVASGPAPKPFTRTDKWQSHAWTNAELAVIESKLSPASLCFSRARALSFFASWKETGPAGPTFIAISTQQGPKIFKPGDRIDPERLRESWFVAWFSGARGWTNWDTPWFLTLQHRPKTIRFDTNGLHFSFDGAAGYAALMPLYGSYKPLPRVPESSPFATLREKKKRVLTWEWHKALPADPLSRARYWASALREFPISVDETYSIDRAHDSITIEQSFRWLSWSDDWNTKSMKLAPISPVLAHAFKEGFPAEFSGKAFDMEIFTDFGPYYGVEGAGSYRVTLPVLRYVHETAGAGEVIAGKLDVPCFLAWQLAHQSLQWEALRLRWPALRDAFLGQATTDWAAFASAAGRGPLEQTADALGAARIAYQFRDMDTYGMAVHAFARALVQLSAQQRGMNYFREHQPWRSMEPLRPDAALSVMNRDGWQSGTATASNVVAGVPDLVRILRDTSPASPDRPVDSARGLERLIPANAPTAFLPHELARGDSPGGLVQTVSADSLGRETATTWPRLLWPVWKTSAGQPWSFGEIRTSKSTPGQSQSIEINASSRAVMIQP